VSLLRGVFFENLGLKLVAIVLALVVYLHVYTERPATMVVSFPLKITDLGDTLAVTSQTPVAVGAELRGTGKQLIRLAERRVAVSLAGVGRGRFQRSIAISDLPVSEPVEVSRMIGPTMFEAQIDRVAERAVPVAARIESALPSGAAWSGVWIAEPARVQVRGPAATVAHLDSIPLAPVRLEPGRDTLRVEVAPVAPAACAITPPTVTLRVPRGRHP
jgi:hypothetical protein